MMHANFSVKDRNKHKMNEKVVNSNVQFLTISDDEAGQRLDNFLLARLKGVPKSLIYRIVRKGEVRVNKGRSKPEYKLQAEDVVRIPPVRVAEKAQDTVSHKLTKVACKVVQAPLLKNELSSGERIVKVSEQGKPSETRFSVEERYVNATLVKASPVTGRTHQIRVHTQYAGHPIALDSKYGDKVFDQQMAELGLNRLFLHAYSIRFEHPHSGETLRLMAQLDEKMKGILKRLREMK